MASSFFSLLFTNRPIVSGTIHLNSHSGHEELTGLIAVQRQNQMLPQSDICQQNSAAITPIIRRALAGFDCFAFGARPPEVEPLKLFNGKTMQQQRRPTCLRVHFKRA